VKMKRADYFFRKDKVERDVVDMSMPIYNGIISIDIFEVCDVIEE
jgi:hypothetical protein